MRVSIVIPNYNGEAFLKKCLDSLQKQTCKDFEVIMVDNCSKDKSLEQLQAFPDIKLIALDKNYGFSHAVNVGIKASRGEFVVLLNNDTEAKEHWLENLVNCIESGERIFSCSSKMIRDSERNLIDDAGDSFAAMGWAYKRGDGFTVDKYTRTEEIFSSCAGAAIYRKSIFEEIGYFDESFFAYLEDVDVSYRAKLQGYKNVYCSSAEIYHIGSATSGSKYNSFKIKLAARNTCHVIYKNMPLLQILLNLPLLIIGFFIKYLLYAIKGFGKDYLSGYMEGLATLSKVQKTKFKFRNLFNYVKVELEMIINLFKYILMKALKLSL